ncbi:MAG: hypothetical protein COU10_02990 [Candidatus Harrisonbacteria bacterium CG10_big_fil_rev_8_21_14_0_10_45_28]|uniref:Glycogen synthase n=1 Tax=Candidatus Harrisonbacteria bacterium CG10_big_fil_rev_8_21_14_0_10_45_28 TaxID=1974586 RepID=A0A2H0UPL6_9BACT|nr:MAG: hypothetical protein COU10_02990 [Candidatus Harrisonbacteria bacterium CG10_big_fil_rev_8_21_14_0_10_45_28]
MPRIFSVRKKGDLKVLFVSTEAYPFTNMGGLGHVMHALPRALEKLGYDVRVMLPKYLSIDEEKYSMKMEVANLQVPNDNEEEPTSLICNVKRFDPTEDSNSSVTTYFLENQEYYEQRANVYGYADDPIRWALLSRGVLEFLRVDKAWAPDVILATDWSLGFLPNYLKTTYKKDPVLSKIASIFSIHNMAYQGMFDHNFVQEMDFDDGHSLIPSFNDPRLMKINGMRRGIMYADAINTISPTYAKEIMTKDFGGGLDDLLRERRAFLYGILDGIDYKTWSPSTDPYISQKYSKQNLGLRKENKETLQNRFGLPTNDDVFVMGIASRLVGQKGFDLLRPIAKTLFEELPIQLVVLGDGDTHLMKYFHELEESYPDKVGVHLKFDPVLPRLVFAGADVVLVPSLFEPSGLVQMEAMRFGAIPIVRKTGGLVDTVEDYSSEEKKGTGFVFEKFDSLALLVAIIRAYENFKNKANWQSIQERAMGQDFSWESSAKKYAELLEKAVEFKSQQGELS